jgi:hypothetical protein
MPSAVSWVSGCRVCSFRAILWPGFRLSFCGWRSFPSALAIFPDPHLCGLLIISLFELMFVFDRRIV